MSDERTRILRMLAEGTISVEECEGLLRALSDRKAEKVEREVREATESRANWPYVLLAILVLLGVLSGLRGNGIFRLLHGERIGTLFLLGTAFWVWMLIDCITRQPSDFKLLFTKKHEHDKWIWCGVLLFANWLGAIVYFGCIYRPTRRTTRPLEPVTKASPQKDIRSRSKQRSPLPTFLILGLIVFLIVILPPLLSRFRIGIMTPWRHFYFPRSTGVSPMAFVGILAIPALLLFIFWAWMLIDCITRDQRDFGTLISSDKSLDKILWILLIFFVPLIGALAYYIAVRKRPRKRSDKINGKDAGEYAKKAERPGNASAP